MYPVSYRVHQTKQLATEITKLLVFRIYFEQCSDLGLIRDPSQIVGLCGEETGTGDWPADELVLRQALLEPGAALWSELGYLAARPFDEVPAGIGQGRLPYRDPLPMDFTIERHSGHLHGSRDRHDAVGEPEDLAFCLRKARPDRSADHVGGHGIAGGVAYLFHGKPLRAPGRSLLPLRQLDPEQLVRGVLELAGATGAAEMQPRQLHGIQHIGRANAEAHQKGQLKSCVLDHQPAVPQPGDRLEGYGSEVKDIGHARVRIEHLRGARLGPMGSSPIASPFLGWSL
jgi:hypothetical protein